MDTMDTTDKLSVPVAINDEMKSYLSEIAKWAKFLSIVGFIIIGFIVVAALAVLAVGSSFGSFMYGIGSGVIAFIYLLFAALYFFPVYYLYQSSQSIKKGLRDEDEVMLTTGFSNLKSHFKFIGILTIIVISLYALIFIFAMITAAIR